MDKSNDMHSVGLHNGPHITIEEASCCDTIPSIPVYHPTESEFAEFSTCLEKIEELGGHHVGLCKIVPPPSWVPRRCGYDNIDFVIEKPILQCSSGTAGVYLQDVKTQKSMTFKKFERMSFTLKSRTPKFKNVDQLEEKYWSSIEHLQPLYGANISGSLTDPDQPACNIPKLKSILSKVFAEEQVKIGGVNTPYLYFGAWATTFAWHVEDIDLYSINYLHFGAPKLWYVIPPAFAKKFEGFAREHFKPEFLACHSFLRHKSILIHPKILADAGIPTRKILQYEGEIMCTFPYGYHAGFNTGLNCAESTNFALPRWIEYGKQAGICTCWDDTVRIDMTPFVRKYQPHLFDAWRNGDDKTPHPLEVYRAKAADQQYSIHLDMAEPPEESYSHSNSSSDGFGLPDGMYEHPKLDEADLNVRGLYYTPRELRKATLPRYLRRNTNLARLWMGSETDPHAETHFNKLMSSIEPFCSICAFFWPPMTVRKVLTGTHSNKPLPASSEPYVSELAFIRSPEDFGRIHVAKNPSSRLLRCVTCSVVVHARCYGVPHLDEINNTIDDGHFEWTCDSCREPLENRRCCLCAMRGGALKALGNHKDLDQQNIERGVSSFWVHMVCAIAIARTGRCRFTDVQLRRPLLLISQADRVEITEEQKKQRKTLQRKKSDEGWNLDELTHPPLTSPVFTFDSVTKPHNWKASTVDLTTDDHGDQIHPVSGRRKRITKNPQHFRHYVNPSSLYDFPLMKKWSLPQRTLFGGPAMRGRRKYSGHLNRILNLSGPSTQDNFEEKCRLSTNVPFLPRTSESTLKDSKDHDSPSPKHHLAAILNTGYEDECRSLGFTESAPNNDSSVRDYLLDSELASTIKCKRGRLSKSEALLQHEIMISSRSASFTNTPDVVCGKSLVTALLHKRGRPSKIDIMLREKMGLPERKPRHSFSHKTVKVCRSKYGASNHRLTGSRRFVEVEKTSHPQQLQKPKEICEECGLLAPGGPANLPLVPCWHENCPGRVHLTCAQLGGWLIATGRYPHCFYVTCRRHTAEYREYEMTEEEVPLEPGDSVYALYPGNGKYYMATTSELEVQRICKVAFQDGTFSRDVPPDCILNHDWSKLGPPKVGSAVKVKWEDNCEYPAVYQGSTFDKWRVCFRNGDTVRLRRDKIFRVNERIPMHIRRLIIR